MNIENAARDGRSGRDIEHAEEPAPLKHRQHKIAMVAQAIVESEEHSVRGWASLRPIDKGLAPHKAISACERIQLTLEIGKRKVREIRQALRTRPHIVIHDRLHTIRSLRAHTVRAFGTPTALLFKHIAERSDTFDRYLDRVPRFFHRAHTNRSAAGDDVARHQGHVLRD